MAPHPLDILSADETNAARDLILSLHADAVLSFREIYLEEPPKQQLIQYLTAEHSGEKAVPPPRRALVQYDVIGSDRVPEFHEAIVDFKLRKRVSHTVVDKSQHASLTL
jgi:primary-amine oxidase